MARIIFYDCSDLDVAQLKASAKELGHQLVFKSEQLTPETVDKKADVVSVFVSSNINEALFDLMPNVRHIACRSTGFDNVDIAAADKRGIVVTNVPSYGEHTVAEYVFTLLLALSRKLPASLAGVKSGKIVQTEYTGFDLNSKVMGIVGAGKIGRRVAEIANGFGMHVLAYDPFADPALAEASHFTYVSLDELLKNSDVISLHVPQTPDNVHLINKAALSKMKKSAVLVNTARGGIVDTEALINALDKQQIAGAALDVLEGEQLLKVQEELLLLRQAHVDAKMLKLSAELKVLEAMPNVIITPHSAFNTVEAIGRINKTAIDNISAVLIGKPINVVKTITAHPGKLIIMRHGESEWNALGVWTGSRDVHLSEKGFKEAALLGRQVTDISFDISFTSQQIRALETLEGVLDSSQQFDVPIERSPALNERDYGDYTGKNKWQVKEQLGEEEFDKLRRDWDYPVPNGETLKDVYDRAVPFYQQRVVPQLMAGKDVLIVSHGNAIRALMKYIESISDQDIANTEMIFGKILIYDVDAQGKTTKKEERAIETELPPA